MGKRKVLEVSIPNSGASQVRTQAVEQEIAGHLECVLAMPGLRSNYERALMANTVTRDVCTPLENYIILPEQVRAAASFLLEHEKDLELSQVVCELLSEIIATLASKPVFSCQEVERNWKAWKPLKLSLLARVLLQILEVMRQDFGAAGMYVDRLRPLLVALTGDSPIEPIVNQIRNVLDEVKRFGIPRTRDSQWATKHFRKQTRTATAVVAGAGRPLVKNSKQRLSAPELFYPGEKKSKSSGPLTEKEAWPWKETTQSLPKIALHLSKKLVQANGRPVAQRTVKSWFPKHSKGVTPLDDRTSKVEKGRVLDVLRKTGYCKNL